MTELVDELFEHPKPRNDDIMDALYYADYFARAPKSTKMSVDDFSGHKRKTKKKGNQKLYNWLTGARY